MPARPLLVSLDVTRTLLRLRRSVGQAYLAAARRHGLVEGDEVAPDTLDRAFGAAWTVHRQREPAFGAQPPPQPPGMRSARPWWRAVVRDTFRGAGLPVAETSPAFDETFDTLYDGFAQQAREYWSVHDDAVALLRFLHGRPTVKVVFLSNFDERLYDILDQFDLRRWVDAVVLSFEVGRDKPDPAMFEAAMLAVNVSDRHRVVHIGNDPIADVRGARSAGCHGWLLDRTLPPNHHTAHATEDPAFSSLIEVPPLLRERFPDAF